MAGRAVVSWSSGKDGCYALAEARAAGHHVVGLLTTIAEETDQVHHHGVPRALVAAQADALDLALHAVAVPSGDLSAYTERMGTRVRSLVRAGVSEIVFGDCFLADLRDAREAKLAGTGLNPVFPLWRRPTHELAREMLVAGVRATVVSVDLTRLTPDHVGRAWDEAFLASLPAGVDPCGEHGEFHTFVHDGPGFRRPVDLAVHRVEIAGHHAHATIA